MKHPLNALEDERSSLGARSSPPAGTITGSTWSWDPMSPTIPFLPWILKPGRKQREKKHRKKNMKKMKKSLHLCVFLVGRAPPGNVGLWHRPPVRNVPSAAALC